MGKIPFRRFIIALLLCGKDIAEVMDRLGTFHYKVTEPEVLDVFNDIRAVLPESITSIVNNGDKLRLSDPTHVEWLQHFGVFEIYDHIMRSARNVDDPPNYFKWCDDCVWIHSYVDVLSIVNIFFFNDEPVDTISDVLLVKYKRKVGADALQLYQDIFWDITDVSAKEALKYCIPFMNNALIIRQCRSGSEIEINAESAFDGCDVPFHFHDIKYIKWKIGYKVEAPKPKDFLEKVQADAQYKYYEAMNMTQSIETEEETGTNEVGGYDSTKIKRRNVEEMRANAAKKWLDLYIKAKEHMPDDRSNSDDFFTKMHQLELAFDNNNEQIANIEDLPDVMDDIKGDQSAL